MEKKICKNCQRVINGFKYDYCKICRSDKQFSQNNFLHCIKCDKNLKTMSSISRLCRNCRRNKNKTPFSQKVYSLNVKLKLNNIQTYPIGEIKKFVDDFELDFNRMQKNTFLLQMLKTIQYHESCCVGTETLNGEVREQLRQMYKELYKFVYPIQKPYIERPRNEITGEFIKIKK